MGFINKIKEIKNDIKKGKLLKSNPKKSCDKCVFKLIKILLFLNCMTNISIQTYI
jgi:hypothetical protein